MDREAQVIGFRRDLHQIPELGFHEEKTQAYLIEALQKMGLSPQSIAGTGVMADIKGSASGKTVALRADMDGLPLDEDTGLPYSSRHPGSMHACGHDGHMAIVLGVAQELAQSREFAGTVRVFFQPAEERPPGGAPTMIAEGCLNGVDEVFGLHLWSSFPVGTAGLRAGAVMANADQFRIRVVGRGGHGSEPEATRDAVLIASQIVVNLQTIVSRRISALEPVVVSCGTIQAGHTFNIIAERAEITGTVRTLDRTVQQTVIQEIRRIAQGTAGLYGAAAELEYEYGYPVVVNHQTSVDKWAKNLDGLVEMVHHQPSLGGEDFAYYLQNKPGAFLFLGAKPEGETFPHHSPHFQINEKALPMGVEILRRAAMAVLG
ncbi:MAG: amidohydrolase [Thermaerobacter sp.]|nr:amidohydrolase [Thermaerobacter sp.]